MKTYNFKPLEENRQPKKAGANNAGFQRNTGEFEKSLLALDPEQKKLMQAKNAIRLLENDISKAKNEIGATSMKIDAVRAEIAKLEDRQEKRIDSALKKIKERHDIELHEYYAMGVIELMNEKLLEPFSFGMIYYAGMSDVRLREVDAGGNEGRNMKLTEFLGYSAGIIDANSAKWIEEIAKVKKEHSLISMRKEMAGAGFVIDWAGRISQALEDDDKIIDWLNTPDDEKRFIIAATAAAYAKTLDGKAARDIFHKMDDVNIKDVFSEMREIYAGLLGTIPHYKGAENFVKACQAETAQAANRLKERHEIIRQGANKLRELGKRRYIYMNNLDNEISDIRQIASLGEEISKKRAEISSSSYKLQLLENQLSWRKNELEQLKIGAGI